MLELTSVYDINRKWLGEQIKIDNIIKVFKTEMAIVSSHV